MTMEAFQDVPPLWDFSTAVNYPQMHDEDFMNLLQKQFPNTGAVVDPLSFGGGFTDRGINPQNVNKLPLPLPSLTPPSEDSSPSPPSYNQDHDDGDGPPATKRKATDDSAGEGPSTKSQHTLNNNEKKTTPTTTSTAAGANRRKSTGGAKDETRLLKRKEQNRAAQRAFRERKEKHVKDLEDRVAELEAKNEEATHENEHLRDLLARLQSENVQLKQQQFTFSMPRAGSQDFTPSTANVGAFASSAASPASSAFSTASTSKSPNNLNPLDWSSLNSFDPNRLNLLDEVPQATATDGAMNLDFGFGNTGLASNAPYTSIASNPMFMSFASSFDSSPPPTTGDSPSASSLGGAPAPNQPFNFDLNSLTAWPTPTSGQENSLDELLQGYMNSSSNYGSFLTSPANVSPIAHHVKASGPLRPTSSSSSPSSSSTDPIYTPKDAATPESDAGTCHDGARCPKNKTELAKRIEEAGQSPFASNVQKTQDQLMGTMISCSGSVSFPQTQRSDQNIEVLTAWRSITSNPKFKDADISELCSEFTKKARCDGQKVVLEPSGVVDILETLSKKQQH